MHNGSAHSLTVRFIRALAFLSEQELDDMVTDVDIRTRGMYREELIAQAINMAPQCTLE